MAPRLSRVTTLGVLTVVLACAPPARHPTSDDGGGNGGTGGSGGAGGVLGKSYMALSYPQKTTKQTSPYGMDASASQVTIVGTQGGTRVTFRVGSQGHTRAGGEVPARGPGESFEFTLEDGDVFNVYSAGESDDQSGSEIASDHPVAVFSGNIGTSYGYGLYENIQSADMTNEQMIPLTAWGRSYVAARILPQSTCRTDRKAGSESIWRILASEDGTTGRSWVTDPRSASSWASRASSSPTSGSPRRRRFRRPPWWRSWSRCPASSTDPSRSPT